MSYIKTIYNNTIRPKSNYPKELAEYLFYEYGMCAGNSILDIGCGRGDILKEFEKLGLEIFSIDKEESIEHEQLNTKYIDIENDKFPYSNNSFDFIFSKSVLEHLHNPGNFMKESYRILKERGTIILMVPDWVSQMKIYYDDYTHVQPYTTNGLYDLLEIFNFRRTKSELFYQLPIIWKYSKLKIISWIIRKFVNPNIKIKNKFIRWSTELMILGSGIK